MLHTQSVSPQGMGDATSLSRKLPHVGISRQLPPFRGEFTDQTVTAPLQQVKESRHDRPVVNNDHGLLAEPAEGSLKRRGFRAPGGLGLSSSPFVYLIILLLWRALGSCSCRPGVVPASERPPKAPNFTFLLFYNAVRVKMKNQAKTFNNGSLGSGIDEERSEMR